MSKKFKITGEFDFEIEAETEQEAIWEAQDNLADLNNIRHEIKEVPSELSEFMLIKTDKYLNVYTAQVKASGHGEALGFVSEVDFIKTNTNHIEGVQLYPNDIQTMEVSSE